MKEIQYNTQQKKLVLPEYGRNVQSMVDYACTIEDKEERTRCAKSIISIMGNLFPHLRDIEDFKHKLWDHLAIMSDFKLDIDYPYEIIRKENLYTKPEIVKYSLKEVRFRHYGKTIEMMLEKAKNIEDDNQRTQLLSMIANHIKRGHLALTSDSDAEDEKICKDINLYTENKFQLDVASLNIKTPKDENKRKNKSNMIRRAVR
ncbi:MAG: DUF4290 domain-containing protein [Bacteroidales bacterium]|nr:DUF4290 domain-containing protein [Bacteroidales bacterium]